MRQLASGDYVALQYSQGKPNAAARCNHSSGGNRRLWQRSCATRCTRLDANARTCEAEQSNDALCMSQVFNNLNFEGAERHSKGQGHVKAVRDKAGKKIWRVYKPDCDKRAEIRGAEGYHQREGETYYIGWRWRMRQPNVKTNGVTVFQWKAYGNDTQNYPFCMGYDGESLSMTKCASTVFGFET